MIVFDGETRVYERKALGIKKVVIDEDVDRGDEVVFGVDSEGVGHYSKSQVPVKAGEEEILIITDEIGLFGIGSNFESEIEVLLLGDKVAIKIVKGAIAIRPENNVLVASYGVDASEIPALYPQDISWVGIEALRAYCSRFGKYASMYTEDYAYVIRVSGGIVNGMAQRNITRSEESADISLGQFAEMERREQLHKDAERAQELASVFMKAQPKFEFEEDPVAPTTGDFDEDDADFGANY